MGNFERALSRLLHETRAVSFLGFNVLIPLFMRGQTCLINSFCSCRINFTRSTGAMMVLVAIEDVAANIVASFLPGLFKEHFFSLLLEIKAFPDSKMRR